MQLSNFGEQFASSVLKRHYMTAVAPAIVNRDYEGEIKKPGDRVNILSFLNDILLSDYVVGTDMVSETIIDAEDQLVVEKRRYYNFALDKLEDLFTYGGDIPAQLLDNQAMVLDREVDTYVLNKFGEETKAGNWLGVDLVVVGGANTMASLVTTATGGTVTLAFDTTNITDQTNGATVENPRDGSSYFGGFVSTDLYKGFRLRSTAAFVSPWYRISGVTSSVVATLTEWDEATSGSDFAEGYTLRGIFGGDGRTFPKNGSGDQTSFVAVSGLGWEFQSAIPTAVTAAVVYDQVTLLAEALDANDTPYDNRKIVGTEQFKTMLLQASETQPTGVSEIYSGTVVNGKVGRFGGFDLHWATGARLSTRSGHNPSTGNGTDSVLSAGTIGYVIPATHTCVLTYADKWSESRVVDAENQFARKYQGLFLYGAKVPRQRRKHTAVLFGSI